MRVDKTIRKALRFGRQEANRVLKLRDKALKRRRAAVRALPKPAEPAPLGRIDRAALRAVGEMATAGVLVAEGDSWFDYPFNDVLRLLEDYHAYDVESVAHKGDPVEEMAYGGGQLEELTRRLEKLLRRHIIPRAVLLSGGGNDVAGDAFGMLLNHARSAAAGLNEQVVAGVIDERVQIAYVTILSAITRVCEQRLNQRIPILVHGYDYPVPDGRGFLGGWWLLPGPWLEPGFREKGFENIQERIRLARQLIDRFNVMLQRVAGLSEFSHVKYINIRNTLSVGADYRRYWANELHPTPRGFELVTRRFAAALANLPQP
ncbi:MAG: SGNH/GDSL hydrolase family protein [Deltaproteobacteria bacterium]|nr:SGNH/GDSL hydrolase family protein [Deltaproteobacteria bacterium]